MFERIAQMCSILPNQQGKKHTYLFHEGIAPELACFLCAVFIGKRSHTFHLTIFPLAGIATPVFPVVGPVAIYLIRFPLPGISISVCPGVHALPLFIVIQAGSLVLVTFLVGHCSLPCCHIIFKITGIDSSVSIS